MGLFGRFRGGSDSSKEQEERPPEETAAFLHALAKHAADIGAYDEAEPLYRQSLALKEASYGPDHVEVASTLLHLSALLMLQNRIDEAVPLLQRCLAIKQVAYGPDHPEVVHIMKLLVGNLDFLGRSDEANALRATTSPPGTLRREGGKKYLDIDGAHAVVHACSTVEGYLERYANDGIGNIELKWFADGAMESSRPERPAEQQECCHCEASFDVEPRFPNTSVDVECPHCGRGQTFYVVQMTPGLEQDLGMENQLGSGYATIWLTVPLQHPEFSTLLTKHGVVTWKSPHRSNLPQEAVEQDLVEAGVQYKNTWQDIQWFDRFKDQEGMQWYRETLSGVEILVLAATTTHGANQAVAVANTPEVLRRIDSALDDDEFDFLEAVNGGDFSIDMDSQVAAAELFAKAYQKLNRLDTDEFLDRAFGDPNRPRNHGGSQQLQRLHEVLLENGMSANATVDGHSLLHWVIANASGSARLEAGAELLIKHGADVNSVNAAGHSCLGAHLSAIGAGRYDFAPYLTHGATLNNVDSSSWKVLVAICQGGLEPVLNLIPEGSVPTELINRVDDKGLTLMHYAVAGDFVASDNPEFIEKQKREFNENAGHVAVVRYLLDRGADPEAADRSGQTPAYYASRLGHHSVLPELLQSDEKQIRVDEDAAKMTPLFAASYSGDTATVRTLLEGGANANGTSFVGYEFDRIVDPGVPPEVSKMLLGLKMRQARERGVFVRMELGIPNLYYPSFFGYFEIVELLLRAGAEPNRIALNGLFPLYLAAEMGHLRVVQALIDSGADVNLTTPRGSTAMRNAVEEGHYDVVRLLLEHGAAANQRIDAGTTALEAAFHFGHADIASLLMQYGAES